MFDVTKIQAGLSGLVGIRQPADPEYARLDANIILSRSGFYLDDVSNFKVAFQIDTMDYKDMTDAQLNAEINNIQKAAIVSVCQNVFGNKSYIDRNYIYTRANTRTNLETTLQNGFVGYKITPSPTKDVAFKITNVKIELDGVGVVKLVLFNSGLNTPIFEQEVIIASNSQIEALNWAINNTENDYKGEYYFGYIYDGTFTPYKRDYDASDVMNDLSELDVEKVYVLGANDATIFDLNGVVELSENTGLNPDITVHDDYTDLILQNDHLFAKAVQLQWAILTMQRYVSTTRSNNIERMSKEVIMRTIETIEGSTFKSPIKVTGLNTLLGSELETLVKAIEDLQKGYFGEGVQVQTIS